MVKNILIGPESTPSAWRGLSLLLFIGFLAIPLLVVVLLNPGSINYLLTPIVAYVDLFQVIWNDNPFGALQFLANKSVFSFAHHDARSGLNLWTLEYDFITLITYLFTALLAASVIKRAKQTRTLASGLLYGLLGATCLVTSVTYMTSIAHCSGPTWAGFVAYYGLGYENFEYYPYWQIALALIGVGLLFYKWLREYLRQRNYL